ncbi:receptor-type tyrosine-protein phosphatase S-like isoform X3 [Clytia hemisphaerica]|uniref:receptor-type tyrosine-protein phosphatase S-like isoform X3 n=1 Tax=Clytia hemisphaerica TaxID=252671 RepID=UPI0034D4A6EE
MKNFWLFVTTLCILLLFTPVVQGEVRISSSTEAPFEGSSVILTCNSSNITTTESWTFYRNNVAIATVNQSNYEVKPFESASFSCEVNGTRSVNTVRLDVKELFTIPLLIINQQTIESGSPLTLQCNTTNHSNETLMFTFFKDNEQINQSNQSNLMIERISTNQKGIYMCNVTIGSIVKTSNKVNVEVILPVSIQTEQTFEGFNTTLICNTPNHETNLSYKWFANNNQQSSTEKTLVLPKVLVTMNGTMYRCEASALNGVSGSGEVVLNVKATFTKPILLLESTQNSYESGSKVKLVCSSQLLNNNISLSYTFLKDGIAITNQIEDSNSTTNENASLTKPTNQRSLIFDPVLTKDAGKYSCHIKSNFDIERKSAPITLNVTLNNVTVRSVETPVGGSAKFTCKVNPQETNVTFQWFRNSQLIPGQTSQNITFEKIPFDWDGSEVTCRATANGISGEGAGTLKIRALTRVDLTISPSNPFEGDTIIFNCSVPETDSDITSWTFRKGDTVLQTGSKHQFNLTSSATLADNEIYTCEATHNSSASMNSTGQTLSVQEIFAKPTISFGYKSAFKTGDKVVISCSTIVRKENTEALYSIRNKNDEEISATNNITIDPIKTENQGKHSCRVTANGITKDSGVKTLFVNLGLSIPTSATVNEGSALSINCTLGGGESGASFTWTENESLIPGQTSQMLRIENVNRTMHQSEYQCNAVLGAFNAASNTANLTVNYLDKPTIAGNTKVNEHDVLSLQCVSTGRPTITTYKWFLNGTEIVDATNQRYEKAGFERSMSGDYSCEVSNGELNQKSDNVAVMALYLGTPTITVNPTDGIPVKENNNLTLTCNIASATSLNRSSLNYNWTKGGESLSTNQVLELVNIKKQDAGNYTCTVTSDATSLSAMANVNVIVHFAPHGISISEEGRQVLLKGSLFNARCSVDSLGLPIGELKWFKKKTSIVKTEESRDLYLSFVGDGVQRGDSNTYHCEATNSIGTVKSNNLTIVVTEVPDAPTKIYHIAASNHITLYWTAPFDGNSDIIRYEVTYKDETTDGGPLILNVTTVQAKIDNLQPNRNYNITIIAVNGIGKGVASNVVTIFTEESAPTEPRSLTAKHNQTGRQLIFSWQEPLPTNGDIIKYSACRLLVVKDKVDVSGQTKHCEDTDGKTTTKTFTGLEQFSKYKLFVKAHNSVGMSEEVSINATTYEGVPTEVRNFQLNTSTTTSLTVQWDEPTNIFGVLTGYMVRYGLANSGSFSLVPACRMTRLRQCKIDGLLAYTDYDVQIEVKNDVHNNVTTLKFKTKTGDPPPFSGNLPAPNKDDVTTNSFTVKLIEFDETNGPVKRYIIVAKKLKSSVTPTVDPYTYTEDDINNGNDGLFVVKIITDRALFGTTVTIKSTSTTSKRRRRDITEKSFTLEADTYYTTFIRGETEDGNHRTTTWYTPIRLAADGLGAGAIAGIVVAIVLIVFLIIVLWYCLYYRRNHAKKEGHIVQMSNMANKKSVKIPTVDPHQPIATNRFEDHVNQLKAHSNYGFSQEYSMINRELEYSYNYSRLQDNNIKNRYHNVPAYDDTRVTLNVMDGESHTDYINANYIDGYERNREYIATQGPLPETIFDFWRMAWESDSTAIVMLTRIEEKGRIKCAHYWPDNGSMALKDILITMTDSQEFPDHVVRTFHITRTGQSVERIVKQFHFVAWPDFGVPADPAAILGFIRKVNNWRLVSPGGPAIIHCSAGVGRTGTYITIDSQIRSMKSKSELQIYKNVSLLRQQRCLMVQTEDQYVFIHMALLDYMESGETEVDANGLRDYIRKHMQTEHKTGMTGLMDEFIRLAKTDKKDRFSEANKMVNQAKNRFKNVYPYDDTRVKLSQRPGVEGSDYINANYIDSYGCKDSFIATQAPLESTIGDFWRMIWEQNCGTIVMLSKEFEGQQSKVHPYWPQKGSPKIEHFIVETTNGPTTYGDYIVREMKLTNTEAGSSRMVKQFQYTTWPDSGSPESGVGIIDLIGQVQKWNSSHHNGIITVHCSAGVGRTGVFIALTNLIERVKTEGVVDVYQTVKKMRQQRTAMVQTRDQYEFCYRALQEYLESFDVYANFH